MSKNFTQQQIDILESIRNMESVPINTQIEIEKLKLEYNKVEEAKNAEIIKASGSVATALVGAIGKWLNTRQLVEANRQNMAYELSGHVFTTTTSKNTAKGITDDLIKAGIQ